MGHTPPGLALRLPGFNVVDTLGRPAFGHLGGPSWVFKCVNGWKELAVVMHTPRPSFLASPFTAGFQARSL